MNLLSRDFFTDPESMPRPKRVASGAAKRFEGDGAVGQIASRRSGRPSIGFEIGACCTGIT